MHSNKVQIPSPAYFNIEVKSPRTKYCTIYHVYKKNFLLASRRRDLGLRDKTPPTSLMDKDSVHI